MTFLVQPVAIRPRPPAPDDRWRPTRAGLVNVWRYWDETFTFHDGRLLLRGPNGSGKSMALELLLPFLLDGDADPRKLTSAAKSRGGLYDRIMTGTTDAARTGFAWLELRRGDDTFTIGARLRASESTRSVDRALFSTTQTIGDDLHLLDDSRVPLSRAALVEAIGNHGRVAKSATEHRDAVRAVLFPDYGADRYDALISALLALRKEKLSQHLDIDKLSEVMSEALPTIDDHELATVAEGFERLDRRRDRIAELEGDVAEVDDVARRQRAYARAVSAAVAADVRRAESARDGIVRRQRLAAEQRDEVAAAVDKAEADDVAARERLRAIGGELQGLRSSDLYREGAELAQLEQDVGRRAGERDRLDEDRHHRDEEAGEAQAVLTDAETQRDSAVANLEVAVRELRTVADEAGAAATLDEALAVVDVDQGFALLSAWDGERRAALAEIHGLLTEHARAVDRRDDAEGHLEHQRDRVDELAAAQVAAGAALDDARHDFTASVVAWADGSTSFPSPWRDVLHHAAHGRRLDVSLDLASGSAVGERGRIGAGGGDGSVSGGAGGLPAAGVQSVSGGADVAVGADEVSASDRAGGLPGADEPARAVAAVPPPDPTRHDGAVVLAAVVEPVDAVDVAVAHLRSVQATDTALAHDGIARRRTELDVEQAGVEAELAPLEHGGWPVVAPPAWRSPRPEARPGAPLWQLVDVIDGTADDVVAGLESALVAAGLADAWVLPTGEIEVPDGGADVALTVLDADRRPTQSLADHLCPSPTGMDHGVEAAVVDAVLSSVATAATAPSSTANRKVVIGLDGTFRLGTAVGRGPVAPAQLLGAAARERHRQAEIARLRALVDECHHRRRILDVDVARVEADAAAKLADLDACPTRQDVDAASLAVGEAEVRLGEADAVRVAAERAVREAEEVVRSTQRRLATRASALRAPTDRAGLDQLRHAVDAVRAAVDVWRRRGEETRSAEHRVELAAAGHERASRAAEAARTRWQAAAEEVEVLTAKVEAVRTAVGTDLADLLTRVSDLEGEERRLGEEREALRVSQRALATRLGEVTTALASATADLAEAEDARAVVQARLVDLHAGPLPSDAGLEPPAEALDGVTAILGRARTLGAELDGVESGPEEIDRRSLRLERRLHDARAALGIRVDLERVPAPGGGWLVLRGSTGGVRQGLRELQAQLRRLLVEAQAELQAEEAALFERTLSGSIRQALADRIRGANELVEAINRQLTEVQTAAAGVSVRLRWGIDDEQPDAVRSARALLLRDPADLDADEREALTDFVRARVEQARAELEAHAPWEARLRESLDYRAWHRFSLQLAHRDWEGFKNATARVLQRLSTGERSVALHLPMIASLAAHYTGPDGSPSSGPRLILLDELFAGVDLANRAQLFGTFTTWDLDAVFTSDHEWCQYASLHGIAIHHLQGGQGDEPVTSTRFTWDGHERRLDDGAA